MEKVVDQKLTVIIAVFNLIDSIRKVLLSINQQSVLPAEVILTDDGSIEDIHGGIADLLPELQFRIKYIRQEDQGFRLAKCRNNGIRESSGKYLVFFDQDILSTPGYIKQYSQFKKKHQFIVAYPASLTRKQTEQITESSIQSSSYVSVINKKQKRSLLYQYVKDTFYHYQRKFIFHQDARPKVRGGVFGLYKSDLLKVDGFDENYQGWGNEDDDLGHRLYRVGIVGKTVFRHEYPIHMYHLPNRDGMNRVNYDYYQKRLVEIRNGDFKAVNGLSNPLSEDQPKVKRLK